MLNSVELFRLFMGHPFDVEGELSIGTASVITHLEKYALLGSIANGLADTLVEDETEVDRHGYTPASRTRSYAALFETLIAEHYSALDGLRRAVYSVFRGVPRVQNASTAHLFERASKGTYGPVPPKHPGSGWFPALNAELAHAHDTWFRPLRRIRTLTVHGETGNCYRDRSTGLIGYWHGHNPRKDGVHIEDVARWLNDNHSGIVRLIEFFFQHCLHSLDPIERPVLCGFYMGRGYERKVAYTKSLSFDDGRCLSRGWFDTEPGCECPRRNECGAYHRPVPPVEREAHYRAKK